ncbi:YciI family protein [Pelomonas sp. KK5]|uniref:YciI family protein n=1 Tax=Pelomonas sp. KK5 TaxID=1855730 RepID=UPI00097CBF93|nr:YciI family protein [Pelomonas sp. KK5]
MLYLRICFDKADDAPLRSQWIQQHRQYVASHLGDDKAVKVVQAGPMCVGDDTGSNLGSFLVVEAPSLADVQAFHDNDPFTRAGLFERADVVRWDRHIGNPSQDKYVP